MIFHFMEREKILFHTKVCEHTRPDIYVSPIPKIQFCKGNEVGPTYQSRNSQNKSEWLLKRFMILPCWFFRPFTKFTDSLPNSNK